MIGHCRWALTLEFPRISAKGSRNQRLLGRGITVREASEASTGAARAAIASNELALRYQDCNLHHRSSKTLPGFPRANDTLNGRVHWVDRAQESARDSPVRRHEGGISPIWFPPLTTYLMCQKLFSFSFLDLHRFISASEEGGEITQHHESVCCIPTLVWAHKLPNRHKLTTITNPCCFFPFDHFLDWSSCSS